MSGNQSFIRSVLVKCGPLPRKCMFNSVRGLSAKQEYIASGNDANASVSCISVVYCSRLSSSSIRSSSKDNVYRQGAMTWLNSLSMVTKYTRSHIVGHAILAIWSKIDVPRTSVSRHSNRLAVLDSEHRLQILHSFTHSVILFKPGNNYELHSCRFTTRWPTKWRRQHWPYRVIANDVIAAEVPGHNGAL